MRYMVTIGLIYAAMVVLALVSRHNSESARTSQCEELGGVELFMKNGAVCIDKKAIIKLY